MRRIPTVLTFLLLALVVAGPASALNDDPGNLSNWTETWIMPVVGTDDPFQVTFSSGSKHYELYSQLVGPIVEAAQVSLDDVGGWLIDVTIPNFVDPLPTKKILVHFDGANSGAELLPSVLSVVGFDTAFGDPGAEELEIDGVFFAAVDTTTDTGLARTETWEIFPNPDWEIIRLFVPNEFELVGIHITTESKGRLVPEPSALLLVGVGLSGLLVAGRRRA